MSYSGNFADAKLIHPLDTKDGDIIGPGSYTLTGATIESANARFGSNLLADASGERLDGDSGVAGFDDNDGKKVLFHTFWQTPNLTGVKTLGGITNSAFTINRTRIFFFSGKITVDWTRQTDLAGPLTPHIRVLSTAGNISVDTSHSLVGYLDSGSATQGKIFIDGIDRTSSVVNSTIFMALVGNHNSIRLGNHTNDLDPAQFVDHFTIIQSDSLTDAKVALLAPQYHDTRGFGYRPTFISVDVTRVQAGDIVNLLGSGFGKDVAITVAGIPAVNVVRVSESSVSFEVPVGLGSGPYDLAITNVESNVTFTQPAALSDKQTTWTAGGTSDRQARVGDGQTVSVDWVIGGPTRWCDPNIQCTPWVRTSVKA